MALLGRHLQVLDLAGAVVWIEHFHFDAVEISITRQRGLAGIAGSRNENAGRLGAAQHLLGFDQQLRHQLQSVVLERAGRTVPQFKRIQAVANLDRLACLAAEGFTVGSSGGGVQEISAVLGQETGQHFFSQYGVRKVFPTFQISLRESFRYKQTALRCQTTDDCFLCRNAECGISGA